MRGASSRVSPTDRLVESLEDLPVFAVVPGQAAGRRADGPDLGRVAAAVSAHQQSYLVTRSA